MRTSIAAMCFALAVFLVSGVTDASVTFTVVDSEGEPISGALVRVADAEHKLGIRAEADDEGLVTFEELPVGSLKLIATASGCRKRHVLVTSTILELDFELRLRCDESEKKQKQEP